MAVNNFLVFDPDDKNILTDAEYLADSQRTNGLESGVARSKLFNKVLKQTSTMAYAIGEVFKAKGINVTDTDVSALIDELDKIFIDNYGNRKSYLVYTPTTPNSFYDTLSPNASNIFDTTLDIPIPLNLYHSYHAELHLFGGMNPQPAWGGGIDNNWFDAFNYASIYPIIDGVVLNKTLIDYAYASREDLQGHTTQYWGRGVTGIRTSNGATSVKYISPQIYRLSTIYGLGVATPSLGAAYNSPKSYNDCRLNGYSSSSPQDLVDKLGDNVSLTGFRLVLNGLPNHTYYMGPAMLEIEFS